MIQINLDTMEIIDGVTVVSIPGDMHHIVTSLANLLPNDDRADTKAIRFIEQNADEKTLISLYDIFDVWQFGTLYTKGRVLRFNGNLWRVVQPHTSQDDWLPPDVPALYVHIAEPGTIPAWRQPQGAHDAYQIGDKVTHNGYIWECTDGNMDEELGVKLNVWEPGVYGWEIAS